MALAREYPSSDSDTEFEGFGEEEVREAQLRLLSCKQELSLSSDESDEDDAALQVIQERLRRDGIGDCKLSIIILCFVILTLTS